MIRADDTGTILFSYRSGCRNGAHRYDHALAKADTIAGAGEHVLRRFLQGRWVVPASHEVK